MNIPKNVRDYMREIGSRGGKAAAQNPNYKKIRSKAAKLRWKRYRAGLDIKRKAVSE